MQISSSNQRSSNQGGIRASSINEQKGKIERFNPEGDSDDDVASVHSAISLVSTESQRRRRMVLAGSPSKKAVEMVTVQ